LHFDEEMKITRKSTYAKAESLELEAPEGNWVSALPPSSDPAPSAIPQEA
jgi:hypothetical protein